MLAEVATLYYLDHRTQDEIARQLGCSIATVSRLLAKAKALDVVEVHVHAPVPVDPALQAALVARFGLRVARVARTSPDEPQTLIPSVSELAARYISTIVTEGKVICLTGGMTMREVVRAIAPAQFRDLRVVQAMGSLGSRVPAMDNPLMTQMVAERLGGTRHLLPAPMIVESPSVRAALAQDPHFQQTLELCKRADIALAGIGGVDPEHSAICRAGYLDPWAMERLRAQGAVGDMMVEFFDIYGRILTTDFGPRIMGMRHQDLRAAGTVIAAAAGVAKAPAILGALRTGLVHVLATDNLTARRILELADAFPIPEQAHGRNVTVTAPAGVSPAERESASRRAILEATMALLERDGYQALTIEAIAAQAAVEPRTLVRWWPTRAALAAEACTAATDPLPRDHGALRDDLVAVLTAIAASRPGHPPGSRLANRTMMAEALLDQEFLPAYRAMHERWRSRLAQVLDRGKSRGEIAEGADADILIEMVLGALTYRLLLNQAPIDTPFLRNIVSTMIERHRPHEVGPPARAFGSQRD